MNHRAWAVVAVLLALLAGFAIGALVGGGAMWALARVNRAEQTARAQKLDREAGVVVTSVEPGGPAALAGMARGDILLELDGEAVDGASDLQELLRSLAPGERVQVRVLHGDEIRTLTATLGRKAGRAYLGLVLGDGGEERVVVSLAAQGALIVEVTAGSPADKAGLRPGDIIVAVDGRQTDTGQSLADLLGAYNPGDLVALQLLRGEGETLEVSVALAEHPNKEGIAYLGVRYRALRSLELPELEPEEMPRMPPDWREWLRIPQGQFVRGLIVREVEHDSPAEAAELQEGDVITHIDEQALAEPDALSAAVAAHRPGDVVALTVLHDGAESEVQVTLGEHPQRRGTAYLGVRIAAWWGLTPLPRGEEEEPGPRPSGTT